MNSAFIEALGSIFFALAVVHTFCVSYFLKWSHHYPAGSFKNSVLHMLGEVEVVFAFWAALFMAIYAIRLGWSAAIDYQRSLDFTEPFFIFVVMVVCSTKPVLSSARLTISYLSLFLQKAFRTPPVVTDLFVVLTLGPLSGSLLTEPAAMTVTAILLHSMFPALGRSALYALIAVLFVNVSIGGALTSFAAPPILMVAGKWGWDTSFVFTHFGWKSLLAVVANSFGFVLIFRRQILQSGVSLADLMRKSQTEDESVPWAVIGLHLFFLGGIVLTGHDRNAFLAIFILFLGLYALTMRYQDSLRLKESILVAVFLGGIIQFGAFQKWWLAPLLASLDNTALFAGAVALTSITDNAALTYLGSQVPDLSTSSQYGLVAGAIAGGGLTIIANAPNAAGYFVLSEKFPDGLRPLSLAVATLLPTSIAILCLWFL